MVMKCSDVQQVLPEFMDGSGDAELQQHLESCPACSELVRELNLIARESRQLAESDEPPARVWVGIANQLRAEGMIRDPGTVPGRPVLVPAARRRWNVWWLAPVAAAILAVGSYQLTHKSASPAPAQQATVQQPAQPAASQPAVQKPAIAQQQAPEQAKPAAKPPVLTAQRHNPPSPSRTQTPAATTVAAELSPPASEEDQQFLSEVSERAPGMRATYEKQLRAVNTEIRETQEYIKRYPGDMDARQHLMEVYQQKALLYQMALDRIQ
jgi:hypothetical protein